MSQVSVQIVNKDVERYMRALLDRHDDSVLLEMEKLGEEKSFPIVGRQVGVTLEILARSIGAKRVFELGSGFGYSAYWFARAVGEKGEVHCTDGDPENARQGTDFLTRARLGDRIRYHVGDAVTELEKIDKVFDI